MHRKGPPQHATMHIKNPLQHANMHACKIPFYYDIKFNSYIILKTIISNIHVSYNQNLIKILQNIPATTCGASSSYPLKASSPSLKP